MRKGKSIAVIILILLFLEFLMPMFGSIKVFAIDESDVIEANPADFGPWDISKEANKSVQAIIEGENNTLKISGAGQMKDWEKSSDIPWYGYKNIIKEIVIENGVITVGNYAFSNCEIVQKVTIPDSVLKIGDYAFYNINSIKTIDISKAVTNIGKRAFGSCDNLEAVNVNEENITYFSEDGVLFGDDRKSLILYPIAKGYDETTYTVPSAVTTIKEYAFEENAYLNDVNFKNVTVIGDYAFLNALSLEHLLIDYPITSLGKKFINGCNQLKYLSFDKETSKLFDINMVDECSSLENISLEGSDLYYADNSMIYNADKTVLYKVLRGVTNNSSNSIRISEITNTIKTDAFYKIDFKELNINLETNNTLLNIEEKAFNQCTNMEKILEIHDNVSKLNANTFYKCLGLEFIVIPETVTSIDVEAFAGCTDLKDIDVSELNTKYLSGNSCLLNKDGTKIIRCFEGAESIQIDSKITTIGAGAFKNCKFTRNVDCSYITTIEDNAFENCKFIDRLNFPKLETIGTNAFKNAEVIENITIQENQKEIFIGSDDVFGSTFDERSILYANGKHTYTNCTFINDGYDLLASTETLMKLGRASVSIDEGKLAGLTYYFESDIAILKNYTPSSDDELYGYFIEAKLNKNSGILTMEAYKYNTEECTNFEDMIANKIEIDDNEEISGIVSTGDWNGDLLTNGTWHDFFQTDYIKEVEIGKGISRIGNRTFYNCNNIENVNILNSKITIGDEAFYSCDSLQDIRCEDKAIEEIGYKAFSEVSSEFGINGNIEYSSEEGVLGYYRLDPRNTGDICEIANYTTIKANAIDVSEVSKKILIPSSTRIINSSGISGYDGNITVVCSQGSAAEKMAKENGIRYYSTKTNFNFTSRVDEIEAGKKYKVVIESEIELQPLEGWTLSDNGFTLSKEFTAHTDGIFVITNVLDEKEEVEIIIPIDAILLGDNNNDGLINMTDVIAILRYIAASNSDSVKTSHPDWIVEDSISKLMDVDGNKKVDMTDVIAVLRHIAASTSSSIEFEHPDWILKDE